MGFTDAASRHVASGFTALHDKSFTVKNVKEVQKQFLH